MHRIFFFAVLVLMASAPLFSGTNKATPPWSHQKMDIKDDKYSCDSSKFITSWIVDNKPVKYCIIIDENKRSLYELESLKIQIELAVKNWLASVPENKFSVYDKNKSKIDLTKVQISYQPDCQNDEQTLLVIFDYGINGQYGCSHVARVQYFYYCSDAMKAIMDKYPLNPYIEIGDPDAFCKIKNPSNGGETDFAYLAKALMEASEKASKDFNYDSDRFCEEYLSLDAKEKCTRFDTTFSTIVHELGHAFGLGDEYAFSRTNLIDYTYGPDVRDISKSVMKDGNRLWPTCDDVLGLVFMFDRLSDYKRGTVSDICPWRKGSYTSSGIQEGNWDYYNPDGGKPEWRITYKSGKRHGLALFYNQEEKFSSCQRFNNGKLCGDMYEYRNDRRTIDNIYGDQLYDDQDISDVKDCPSDIPQCPETNN